MTSDIMGWIPKKYRNEYRRLCEKYDVQKMGKDGKTIINSLADYYQVNYGNVFTQIMSDNRLRVLTCFVYADVVKDNVMKEWKLRGAFLRSGGIKAASIPVDHSMVCIIYNVILDDNIRM